MRREQLLHVIRAAAKICDEAEFVVIGSQAAHASIPDLDDTNDPENPVLRSMEADIYPLRDPSKSERLNEIGELSRFHEQNGYYADPVDDKTAILPKDWIDRVETLTSPLTENEFGLAARAFCPDLHDLAISKLVRGLEKDLEFVRDLDRRKLLSRDLLLDRLRETKIRVNVRRLTIRYIRAFVGETSAV